MEKWADLVFMRLNKKEMEKKSKKRKNMETVENRGK